MCSYTYLHRGYENALVLLSGWGTYGDLFTHYQAPYNYIVFDQVSSSTVEDILIAKQALGLSKLSLLGFSMGGFLAAAFAQAYPAFVHELTLVGVRQKYSAQDIAMVKGFLNRGKAGYMRKFYQACFFDPADFQKAETLFVKGWLSRYDLTLLQEGLDFLGQLSLIPEMFLDIPQVHFVHGKQDIIAPVAEVEALLAPLPQAKFTLLDEGHLPLSFFD